MKPQEFVPTLLNYLAENGRIKMHENKEKKVNDHIANFQ